MGQGGLRKIRGSLKKIAGRIGGPKIVFSDKGREGGGARKNICNHLLFYQIKKKHILEYLVLI